LSLLSGKSYLYLSNIQDVVLFDTTEVALAGGAVLQMAQASLRIKPFIDTTDNAVKTQIFVALSTYLLWQ